MAAPLVDSTDAFVEQAYQKMAQRLNAIRQRLNRPLTYAEKQILGHLDDPLSASLTPGESYLMLRPDRVGLQDVTGQMAILQFMQAGRPQTSVPTTIHCDHLIQARIGAKGDTVDALAENKEIYEFIRTSANKYGIGFWGPGAGIIHQVMLENYAFPGCMLIGTDSHTPNAGGLATFASGVGGADAVDVIAPSIPGYGFSDATDKRGLDALTVGDMWARLMSDTLGYHRFAAQGGDWGARVTAKLGLSHGDKVIGIHTTSTTSPTPYLGVGSRALSEAETGLLQHRENWLAEEGGYSHIQSTKPQTLSYGLNDSPAGLAAWIVEKYRTWSDCGGDVESRFTKDELLTTITIYWVTGSINSSTRLYYEGFNKPWDLGKDGKIQVPVAVACLLYTSDAADE